jgi:hypothetical protein
MKLSIDNGRYLGSIEWVAPGEVVVDMEDPRDRAFFESYFESEDSFLSGPVESAEMTMERRDQSEQAFARAAFRLSAFEFKVYEERPQGANT